MTPRAAVPLCSYAAEVREVRGSLNPPRTRVHERICCISSPALRHFDEEAFTVSRFTPLETIPDFSPCHMTSVVLLWPETVEVVSEFLADILKQEMVAVQILQNCFTDPLKQPWMYRWIPRAGAPDIMLNMLDVLGCKGSSVVHSSSSSSVWLDSF